MEGLNAERSESAEDAALREAEEAEDRERSTHADALGLGGMLGDEEMEVRIVIMGNG